MSDLGELLALADKIASQAIRGEQIEAYVGRGTETSIRVYEGEVEQFTSAQSEGIGIRVIRDGRTGFASAGTLDATVIDEVLADARENTEFGSPDEWAALAEPDGVAVVHQELWNERLAAYGTAGKIAMTKELERLALATDRRIRIEDANYSDGAGEMAVATSTGIRATARGNNCYVSVSTMADDGDETQTGWGFSVGAHPEALDLARAAQEGSDRAIGLLGAVKPASQRLTVVFDPFVTAQFLGILSSTLNGEAVLKGRSLFANRLGETVAHPNFTLVDDPTNPLAYTATELDGEGLAARRNVMIEGGVLKMFAQSSYSGRRSGSASTGNAVRGGYAGSPGCGLLAIQLVPGERQQPEIIASIDNGVLIQSVSGMHSGVNAISGDFSTGASGRMIRNGTLAEPVREFTIASTIQRMLSDIIEIGGDVDWLPMRATGLSLVIGEVTMSGA